MVLMRAWLLFVVADELSFDLLQAICLGDQFLFWCTIGLLHNLKRETEDTMISITCGTTLSHRHKPNLKWLMHDRSACIEQCTAYHRQDWLWAVRVDGTLLAGLVQKFYFGLLVILGGTDLVTPLFLVLVGLSTYCGTCVILLTLWWCKPFATKSFNRRWFWHLFVMSNQRHVNLIHSCGEELRGNTTFFLFMHSKYIFIWMNGCWRMKAGLVRAKSKSTM